MRTAIVNARIVTPDTVIEHGVCAFTDGVIDYIGTEAQTADALIDAQGDYLMAGFVDLHCHGGAGRSFMDATVEDIAEIAAFHRAHGTTTMLLTTLAAREEETAHALDTFAAYRAQYPDSTLAGVHLEGPCLSAAQCGAQNTAFMKDPADWDLCAIKEKYPFVLRVSAAPELAGGMELGKQGQALGIQMSVAHTDADFDTTETALSAGYTSLTHLYSGMRGVIRQNAFRVAGAVEAGLCLDGYTVEMIADGCHLPASLLRLIYHCKGADKICLVTDAIRAAGLPEGAQTKIGSLQNGLPVVVEDGVAKLPDRQSFAGSVATFDRLVQTVARLVTDDPVALSKMASATPARLMGFADRGTVEVGKRADLVIVTPNYQVKQVITKEE